MTHIEAVFPSNVTNIFAGADEAAKAAFAALQEGDLVYLEKLADGDRGTTYEHPAVALVEQGLQGAAAAYLGRLRGDRRMVLRGVELLEEANQNAAADGVSAESVWLRPTLKAWLGNSHVRFGYLVRDSDSVKRGNKFLEESLVLYRHLRHSEVGLDKRAWSVINRNIACVHRDIGDAMLGGMWWGPMDEVDEEKAKGHFDKALQEFAKGGGRSKAELYATLSSLSMLYAKVSSGRFARMRTKELGESRIAARECILSVFSAYECSTDNTHRWRRTILNIAVAASWLWNRTRDLNDLEMALRINREAASAYNRSDHEARWAVAQRNLLWIQMSALRGGLLWERLGLDPQELLTRLGALESSFQWLDEKVGFNWEEHREQLGALVVKHEKKKRLALMGKRVAPREGSVRNRRAARSNQAGEGRGREAEVDDAGPIEGVDIKLREEFAGVNPDVLLAEISRLRAQVGEQAVDSLSSASLTKLVDTLESGSSIPPEGLVSRLAAIVREAQVNTPSDRYGFGDQVNEILDGYALRFILDDGRSARIAVLPTSKLGTIQFSLSPRGTTGFKKRAFSIARSAHKATIRKNLGLGSEN